MGKQSDLEIKPKLTSSGARRALNFIQNLVEGEKETVTFYRAQDGSIRELSTKIELTVTGTQRKSNPEH